MKKLLASFSGLSVFPILSQLTIACEKNELLQIVNSINSIDIGEINENELKEWCINWIKNIENKNQPHEFTNEKLKEIILINLGIYAVAHFIKEEEAVKTAIKQLNTNNNGNLDPIISALEKISEEKIVKALMFVFLILKINDKDSAFECEFKQQNEQNKRFEFTVKKAKWDDIKDETNQAFIESKKMIVETSANKLLNDLNLPSSLKKKAEKVQRLIKHVKFENVKDVFEKIANEKTFIVDFNTMLTTNHG